jgi:hypothetical protein
MRRFGRERDAKQFYGHLNNGRTATSVGARVPIVQENREPLAQHMLPIHRDFAGDSRLEQAVLDVLRQTSPGLNHRTAQSER